MEEGQGQTIYCAASRCEILVDDQTVFSLITDPKVKQRYQHLITNSFVEVSDWFVFSPLTLETSVHSAIDCCGGVPRLIVLE